MELSEIKNNIKFDKFYNMLIETNKQFNLTSITDKNDVYVKHFLDSIFVENQFDKNANVVDVGTGAGFPSVPLAIVRSDLNILAIDGLNKRVNFVNNVKKELQLPNLKVEHLRSEELAKNKRETFDIATSRAVASLPTLLEWLAPLVKVGGKIVCYKGKDVNEEILRAKKAEHEFGLKLENVLEYNLGGDDLGRTLVIYKKQNKTPQKYPRSANKAQKSPIE